jgi:DNA-binding beta-propeller fold protein YncE
MGAGRPTKTVVAALGLLCAVLSTAGEARGQFVKIAEHNIGFYPFGIAFDGTQWHIAEATTRRWGNFDANFNFISFTTLSSAPVNAGIRGLDYDASSNHLFVVDHDQTRIYESTLAGGGVQNWFYASGSAPQDVTVDPRDNTLWIAEFGGTIQHRTKTGTLLGSFSTGLNLTGVALDVTNDSLLVLQTNFPGVPDDEVYEFRTNGTPLGQLMGDQVVNNGQGIDYDPLTGKLYVTSGIAVPGPGTVTVFQDVTRIPEPTGTAAVFIAVACRSFARPRRRPR